MPKTSTTHDQSHHGHGADGTDVAMESAGITLLKGDLMGIGPQTRCQMMACSCQRGIGFSCRRKQADARMGNRF